MVDARVSNTLSARSVGSTPTTRTNLGALGDVSAAVSTAAPAAQASRCGWLTWGAKQGAHRMDQFYTQPDLAHALACQVSSRWPDPNVLFVEPSAGMGAFVRPLRKQKRQVRALDLAPRESTIAYGNFLENHDLFGGTHCAIVVLGNPPFGKNASLAVKFFNRAAGAAAEIAFIVPRTFRKMSLQKRLERHFHLSCDHDLPDHCFLKQGKPYNVPCAWQIWTRKAEPRFLPTIPSVAHLIQYTTAHRADFAMRRVGYYAGRVITEDISFLSPTTHYFVQAKTKGVIEFLRRTDWSATASQTAGVRSLSKAEIALKLGRAYRARFL